MKTPIIVIDPGHFGSKTNQSPVVSDYYESNMTWALAQYLKASLEKYGFLVKLTRTKKDKNPSLYDRGMKSKGSDLFLSLHSDASSSEASDHVSVFHSFDNANNSQELAKELADTAASVMGVSSGKVKTKESKTYPGTEHYGVLNGARKAKCPLYYIIEHSFHTNKKSALWLLEPSNLQKLAEAEALAIARYFGMADIPGDVDGDGKLTQTDVEIIRLAVMGRIKLCDELAKIADVNRDGKVDVKDYSIVKKAILQ